MAEILGGTRRFVHRNGLVQRDFLSFASGGVRPGIRSKWRRRESGIIRKIGMFGIAVEGVTDRDRGRKLWGPDLDLVFTNDFRLRPQPFSIGAGNGELGERIAASDL